MNKSGLAVKGLTKTAELIDPGYVGTIKIALQYDRGMEGEPALKFKRGDKIAQIMFVPFVYPDFVTIDNPDLLGESMRGDGGFGSTGK
jgi:dUTPase